MSGTRCAIAALPVGGSSYGPGPSLSPLARYGCAVADLATLVSDLQRLIDVESPSLDLEALARSADNLAELIAERTGRPATNLSDQRLGRPRP